MSCNPTNKSISVSIFLPSPLFLLLFCQKKYYECINRLSQVESKIAGQMSGLLASGKAIAILDSSHGENAMVLLVRYCSCVLQHNHRCSRTLWTAKIPERLLV
jgi:hypothetical protein